MTGSLQIPGVDLTVLDAWMDEQELPPGPLEGVRELGGGTQNILMALTRGGASYVLRRPPLHKRANSDETMRREVRVLRALEHTEVPHPTLVAACGDVDVMGAAFYLMDAIAGFNPTTGLPASFVADPRLRHETGLAMADGIAALAGVDYVEVGLSDLGRTDHYLARQVPRWQAQLDGYRELEGYPGPAIPGLHEVGGWLERNLPAQSRPGIIHGDYHFANVLVAPDSPRLAAIVDWELWTIGDPLVDLGWLLATWPEPDGTGPGAVTVEPWVGFPDAHELIERYRAASPRNLDAIGWYEVLACYKLGIILEGTHARACAGRADGETGDRLHATTLRLFERAVTRIASA